MESGSNKSLYTLIAVVVFGIFLSLSYFLFQDNLKGVLANVMDRTSVTTSIKLDNDGLLTTDPKYFSFNATTGTITSFTLNGSKDIIIPSVIDGVVVTAIGQSVFSDIQLNSVIVPDSVTTIGTNAFWNCGLKEIKLSNNLTTLAASSLAWNKLKTLELPDSLTILGGGALRGNQLTTLKIPSGVTALNDTVFSHNDFVSIELPKHFENSSALTTFIDYYSWDASLMVNITYLTTTTPSIFTFY